MISNSRLDWKLKMLAWVSSKCPSYKKRSHTGCTRWNVPWRLVMWFSRARLWCPADTEDTDSPGFAPWQPEWYRCSTFLPTTPSWPFARSAPASLLRSLSIRDSFWNCQFGNRECHSGTKLLNYVIRRVSVFISAFCETEEREKRHLPLITVVNHRPLIGVENPVKTTPS